MHDVQHRIGLVTDSNSQITSTLIDTYAVEVVPMTVTIDGDEFREGVDLDADGFYAHFDDGSVPAISTSQPSPGEFAVVYERLAVAGCDEIVSIHVAEDFSGTIGSARVAAGEASIPVHLVDAGTASFGTAICVWSAGETIRRGGNVDDIRRRIADLSPRIGTAFMIGVPMLIDRGGRSDRIDADLHDEGIAIVALSDGKYETLDRVHSIDDTVEVMRAYALTWDDPVTVAVGTADGSTYPLANRLTEALVASPKVDDVVQYRVGPSVGAHMGPGTFGLFVFPTVV